MQTSETVERERSEPVEITDCGWGRAFQNIRREHDFEPLRVEGTIPSELEGTLYRNGPGLVRLFDRPYRHWFDGDGAISAVRFEDGRASGAVRLLQTRGLLEERERGAPYYGAYGTRPPGFFNPVRLIRTLRGSTKNPANTNLLAWHDRLFALCEIGRPFELDPRDLSSIGETSFDVIARSFSAHPHRNAKNGCFYNIGLQFGRPNCIDLFVMRPDGTAGQVAQVPLGFATMIHDFAVTEHYAIVFVAPLRLKLFATLFGSKSFQENLVWDASVGTEVILIPFDAPASPIRFHCDPFWAWHIGNAYDRGRKVVLDLVRYPDFVGTASWLDGIVRGEVNGTDVDGILTRTVIDPKRRRLTHETLMGERTGEFPRVAPHVDARQHRVMYWCEHSSPTVGRNGPQDSLARVDTETGHVDRFVFEPGLTPSEGVFVPRPGASIPREDDGWIITQTYDARSHTTGWSGFDAAHLSDGPLFGAHLDHHVPLSFHGQWMPRKT